jgi:DNA topoisomerase IB
MKQASLYSSTDQGGGKRRAGIYLGSLGGSPHSRAAELGNTPAICRKSYVHETVINAFEDGVLEDFAETLRASRSTARRAKVLAEVAAQIEATPHQR